jgi:hypothetical protein
VLLMLGLVSAAAARLVASLWQHSDVDGKCDDDTESSSTRQYTSCCNCCAEFEGRDGAHDDDVDDEFDDDIENVKGMARLFCEVAEAYIQLILAATPQVRLVLYHGNHLLPPPPATTTSTTNQEPPPVPNACTTTTTATTN